MPHIFASMIIKTKVLAIELHYITRSDPGIIDRGPALYIVAPNLGEFTG